MREGWRAFRSPALLVTLGLVLVADLWSKAWAWEYVSTHADPRYSRPRVVVIEDFLLLGKELNTGTLWGLAKDYTFVLILLRVAILTLLLVLVYQSRRGQRFRRIGLGLVLGGAIGNLHDNLTRADNAVRDFIDVKIPLPWRDPPFDFYDYPVFNIADASVLVGAFLLFFAYGATNRPEATEAAQEPPPEPEPARGEDERRAGADVDEDAARDRS